MPQEDLRKARDGTFEFACRDAHSGEHSRWGDMEILGYNLYQWLLCRQPWEDNLKDPEYISEQKSSLIEDISLLMTECFPRGQIPCCITEFLQYVSSVNFEVTADYKRLQFLEKSVQAAGFVPDGTLHFTLPRTPWRSSFTPKKPVLQEIIFAEDSPSGSGDENAVGKPPPANVSRGSCTASVRKDNRRLPRATKSASGLGDLKLEPDSFCEGRNSRGLDNPIRPCWKCFSSSRHYWSNSRKGVVTLPPARYCPSPP
ncbi:hypothetical protein HPB50_027863 [Hyalomma asiaticum]|nr:hypothetical protein HPB50_027863 [Hyalomma asiaticum]